MDKENELLENLPELMAMLEKQLMNDYERWGNEWKRRSRRGQEERILKRIGEYIDAYYRQGTPVPWKKIVGLCWIAIYRETFWKDDLPC